MRRIRMNGNPLMVVDRWDELKLKHLLGLEKINVQDEAEIFGLLSGVPIQVIDNAKAITEEIYNVIAFIYTESPDWEKLKPPTHLLIAGKPYKLPKPDKCTLGQNIMLDNLMAKPLLEIIPRALAIYFQPLIDGGKFDRHRLEAVEAMIMESSAIDTFATASFFLHNGKNLQRIMQVGYLFPRLIPLPPSSMMAPMTSTENLSGSITL